MAPHYLQSPGKQLWVTIQSLRSPNDLASPLSHLTSNLASFLNLPCRSPSHGSAHAVLLVECPSSPPSLWKNSVLFKKKFSMGITSSRTPQLLPSVNSQRVMTKSINFFWLCHGARGLLVPQPGIEPAAPALEGRSLNHWATGEPHGSLNSL